MVVRSISYDQDEIIQGIMTLHLDGAPFECDPTYSKGVFYKNLPAPRLKFDLAPQYPDVIQSDCRNLPLEDESIQSIMFDPPFLQRSGKGSIMKDRFGEFNTIPNLWMFYYASLKEFYRVLRPGGILAFKCQDTVSCGKNYMSHVEIMNQAVSVGFYPKDIFILLAKSRMSQWNIKKQQHARKFHSYFWVFEKRKSPIEYSSANVGGVQIGPVSRNNTTE